ncbi:MAG: metal-sulfur cluster assembly factor [Anaerolineales bacterium]
MNAEQILETLKFILDPEVGVNIVDLGLIYNVCIDGGSVSIDLTMTTPLCPLHGMITHQMDTLLRKRFPELNQLNINLVWEPRWTPEKMSATARRQLGW